MRHTSKSISARLGRRSWGLVASLLLAAAPRATHAHGGAPADAASVLWWWNASLPLIAGMTLAGFVYMRGAFRLWKRAGAGRGLRRWQVTSFWAGMGALVLALISPLDELSGLLFSAHMLQHLLLILVAAPLLVASNPAMAFLWALRLRERRLLGRLWKSRPLTSLWQALGHPLSVLALYTGVLWLWHMPRLYDAAVVHEPLHYAEHGLFLAAAAMFWWRVLSWARASLTLQGVAVGYLFAAMLLGGALGGILSIAGQPVYSSHAASGIPALRLDALADQQIGGLMMMMPASLIYTGMAAVILLRIFGRLEREGND